MVLAILLTVSARSSSGGGSSAGSSSANAVSTSGKSDNGSVSADKSTAKKGDTVAITVTPDAGYELGKLTVTDSKGNGKYTFTMPAGKVEVKASFAEEAETSPFADVVTDAYYYEAVKWAAEQGITWVDTAPIYGLYHSETVVGEAMKHIDRDKVVLSTKCGLEWRHETPILHKVVDGVQVYRDLSAKSIIEDVEDSLRRLHTDHLDVLYTHWQSPDFGVYPLEETMEAMMKLKEQGKIRAIGASNVTSDIIRGYCRYGQLDVIQEKYSLLTRRIEKQLLPTCKELGVSVQAYSPLEQGLLTGKVTMDTTYPEGSTRNTNPCFQPTRRAQALELLAKWGDLTEKYDCTMAQLVIAMTARMIPGLHVLCGARKPEQVLDNAGALHIKLDGADAVRMKWDVDAIS